MNNQVMVDFLYNGERLRDVVHGMINRGETRRAIAMMLRQLGCVDSHVRYVCGPVISKTPQQAQAIPKWLSQTVLLERVNLIFDEICNGIVGFLAGPTDVLTYLHPVDTINDACWDRVWSKVHLCVKDQMAGRDCQNVIWELVDPKTGQPASTLQVAWSPEEAGEYYNLAYKIRHEVVMRALPGDPLAYPWNTNPGNGINGLATFEDLFRSKQMPFT